MGHEGVYRFYGSHLVGRTRMPSDTKIVRISRTVGKDQVVDELILSFTYGREIDFTLRSVPSTGKHVELAHVVVMKFKGGRTAHEFIYWDQESLLAQIGLLDEQALTIFGVEQTKKLLELSKHHH